MLRQCIQGATRQRSSCRQWSSLPSTWDQSQGDDTQKPRHPLILRTNQNKNHVTKRHFSISRYTDKLTQHGTINTLDDDESGSAGDDRKTPTADDLEYDEILGIDDDGKQNEGSDDAAMRELSNDYGDIFADTAAKPTNPYGNDEEEQDEEALADAAYAAKQEIINAELDKRTGRLWTEDWVISDEEWLADESFEDIEDWRPTNATRKSMESVQVWEGGVPTLLEMSRLELPEQLPPHPGSGNPAKYATFRKRQQQKKLHMSIQLAIHDDLQRILGMVSWEEKQEAVDDLFEVVEERVREREPVMAKLPDFSNLVEVGLQKVLGMVQERMQGAAKEGANDAVAENAADGESKEGSEVNSAAVAPKQDVEEVIDAMGVNKVVPAPIFMDILAATRQVEHRGNSNNDDEDSAETPSNNKPSILKFFSESNDDDVPNLLYPLNIHHRDGTGRMVEEWQLTANKDTKRIMMRDAMREIASKVVESANCCSDGDDESGVEKKKGAARVFVSGERVVGKTAALAGMVASARLSGHIVVYLPDGDRLRRHGYYIDPCQYQKGLYNLPEIAKELCDELLTSHGEDVANACAPVSREDMKEFFSDDQLPRLFRRAYADDDSVTEEDQAALTELSLDKVLAVGIGSSNLSSACYGIVVNKLMNQTEKPFTVVMDEFNCYYDHGHYFHMDYDDSVRKGVPPNRITIFKPFMDAMGLYPTDAGNDFNDEHAVESSKALMKWGSIIVGTSESRAVRRSFTQSLTESAHASKQVNVVDVRRFTNVEVQHMLYNYEITGIGRLRFDRGDTALNPEEVEYLRLVSGGLGQRMLDSVMIP